MQELGGTCDFSADVALYYPLHVIMSVLRCPRRQPRMLRADAEAFGAEDPTSAGRRRTGAARGADGLLHLLNGSPSTAGRTTNDIASTIANAHLEDPAASANSSSRPPGDATSSSPRASEALSGPGPAPRAARRLKLIDAVDEMIRWVTPVRHFMRYAQEDATVARRVRKGAALLAYLSGNRDRPSPRPVPSTPSARTPRTTWRSASASLLLGAHLARMSCARSSASAAAARVHRAGRRAQYTATTFVGAEASRSATGRAEAR